MATARRGALITVGAIALGVIYAVVAFEYDWWLPTAAMFFGPAIVGGLLFTAAGIIAAMDAADG